MPPRLEWAITRPHGPTRAIKRPITRRAQEGFQGARAAVGAAGAAKKAHRAIAAAANRCKKEAKNGPSLLRGKGIHVSPVAKVVPIL